MMERAAREEGSTLQAESFDTGSAMARSEKIVKLE